MKKSYSNEKSLQINKSLREECLQKNRHKLSRQLYRDSLKGSKSARFFKQSTKNPLKSHKSPLESTRQSTKSTRQSTRSTNKFSKVNTILKLIAFRKTKQRKRFQLKKCRNYIERQGKESINRKINLI